MYLVRKWRLFKVKRMMALLFFFFMPMHLGYLYSGLGKNIYTLGYMNGFYQAFDYSLHMMNTYGGDEKTKYTVQILSLLKDGLDSKGECYDTLDWLMLGQHFAKNQEEETSFQAYYMAHLLDYDRIRTNS
jgi:hypothetical protein